MAQQLNDGNDPFLRAVEEPRIGATSRGTPFKNSNAAPGTWESTFLAEIMRGSSVTDAITAAGVEITTPYKLRKRDAEFRRAWNEASEIGTELLEAEAQRRAYHGVLEPVFYKGVICGHVRKYSDGMLMRLLAARKPEVYGNTGEEGGRAPLNVSINVAVENNPPAPPPPELVVVVDENSREEDPRLPETGQIPPK